MTKRKDPKDYLKMGRPTKYSVELADEICEKISSNSCGLQTLCFENPHWPERSVIFVWMRRYPDFKHKYAVAKYEQVEVDIDDYQEIMSEEHTYVDEFGNKRIDVPMLRAKLDAIKWKAGKLMPKKYGNDNAVEDLKTKTDLLLNECKLLKDQLDEKNKKDY